MPNTAVELTAKAGAAFAEAHRDVGSMMKNRSKEIQSRIAELLQENAEIAKGSVTWPYNITFSVAKNAGELIALSAEQLDISTRRLIGLTWGLVTLTVGLLVFTKHSRMPHGLPWG